MVVEDRVDIVVQRRQVYQYHDDQLYDNNVHYLLVYRLMHLFQHDDLHHQSIERVTISRCACNESMTYCPLTNLNGSIAT
jgi:hypothetical protein